MTIALLQSLPFAIPMGLCTLFLAAAAAMSWVLLIMEAVEMLHSKSTPHGVAPGTPHGVAPGTPHGVAPGSIVSGLLESSFAFAAAAGMAVLLLPGIGGIAWIPIPPKTVSWGIVLFLAAAAFLGILRSVRPRRWPRRIFLLAFAAAATALFVWTLEEVVDGCRSMGSLDFRPRLPEPLILAGLAALCLFLIGASLQLLSDALRERRRDGPGGPLVRP